jgi:hypothetical protein
MIDWKKFVPDEPFISDHEFFPPRPAKGTPPAVKNWCRLTIVVNILIATAAAGALRHVWPLLLGVIFVLLPLYVLFCWTDIASAAALVKERANRSPLALRINIGAQWLAISVCLGCTLMLCVAYVVVWSTMIAR